MTVQLRQFGIGEAVLSICPFVPFFFKKVIIMPQLDTVTFFSQFFWLSFFFLGFYGILVKYYLPKMSRILKVRTRKVSASQGNFVDLQEENGFVRQNVDSLVMNGMKHSFDFFQEKTKNTSEWTQNVLELTNKNQFQTINKKYLSTVSDFQASDILLFHHLKFVLAPNAFQVAESNFPMITKEKMYNFRLFENIMK